MLAGAITTDTPETTSLCPDAGGVSAHMCLTAQLQGFLEFQCKKYNELGKLMYQENNPLFSNVFGFEA